MNGFLSFVVRPCAADKSFLVVRIFWNITSRIDLLGVLVSFYGFFSVCLPQLGSVKFGVHADA